MFSVIIQYEIDPTILEKMEMGNIYMNNKDGQWTSSFGTSTWVG